MPKNNQNRWVFKPKGESKAINHIEKELNIPNTIANLLVQRGLDSFEKAKSFFAQILTNYMTHS